MSLSGDLSDLSAFSAASLYAADSVINARVFLLISVSVAAFPFLAPLGILYCFECLIDLLID